MMKFCETKDAGTRSLGKFQVVKGNCLVGLLTVTLPVP